MMIASDYTESQTLIADKAKAAADKAKKIKDDELKAKANAEMAYNNFELSAREDLQIKKQGIAEDALKTNEYALQTN